jgi:hypothetical protein
VDGSGGGHSTAYFLLVPLVLFAADYALRALQRLRPARVVEAQVRRAEPTVCVRGIRGHLNESVHYGGNAAFCGQLENKGGREDSERRGDGDGEGEGDAGCGGAAAQLLLRELRAVGGVGPLVEVPVVIEAQMPVV